MARVERQGELTFAAVVLSVALWDATSACRVADPPRPCFNRPASSSACIQVQVSGDGPINFTFNGATFAANQPVGGPPPSWSFFDLAAGTYEIAGDMSGTSAAFAIRGENGTVSGGALQPFTNIEGPLRSPPSGCIIVYANPGSPPTTTAFRFSFTIGAGPAYC